MTAAASSDGQPRASTETESPPMIAPITRHRQHSHPGWTLVLIAVVAMVLAACARDTGDVSDPNATPENGPATVEPTTSATTPPGTATPDTATPVPTTPDQAQPDSATPVVVLTHVGGCMMMGPNCLEWSMAADGTWTATRAGEDEQVATGQVPADLVTAVTDGAESAVADSSLDNVGPGECQACFDGIDLLVQVTTPTQQITLDSVEQDFSADLAVFNAIAMVDRELTATTDVELVSR